MIDQVLRRVGQDDASRLEHVAPLGNGQGHVGVLLHQQDGDPLAVEILDDLERLLHVQRGEPHGGLVHDEQPRAGQEGPGDGQHLLLTARERPPQLPAPLPQDREPLVDRLDILPDPRPVGARVGPHEEVLVHRELGEDAAALQHRSDPRAHHLRRRVPVDGSPPEEDLTPDGMHEPQDRLHGGGFAGGVPSQETHQFPLADREGHLPQDLHGAVARGDASQLKHGRTASPCRPGGPPRSAGSPRGVPRRSSPRGPGPRCGPTRP